MPVWLARSCRPYGNGGQKRETDAGRINFGRVVGGSTGSWSGETGAPTQQQDPRQHGISQVSEAVACKTADRTGAIGVPNMPGHSTEKARSVISSHRPIHVSV